jgi:predicted transposase/invertase (TIGR01784 family)
VVAHPNDAMFKHYLTQPVHAASLIRAVFPQELVDRLNLDHLELVPGSFVDEDLTDRHCDVLMRTRFAGREAFVFTIIEHQSSPDRMMPLRMVEYMVKVWRRYRRDNPNTKRLPLILPLVVYSSSTTKPRSTSPSCGVARSPGRSG